MLVVPVLPLSILFLFHNAEEFINSQMYGVPIEF